MLKLYRICGLIRFRVSSIALTWKSPLVYSQLSNQQIVVGEWQALQVDGSAVRDQRERFLT
jgi:hypothetical protein